MSTHSEGRPAALGCPRCTKKVRVSKEYPDAAMSEMRSHLFWYHCGQSNRRTEDLLAQVREVA